MMRKTRKDEMGERRKREKQNKKRENDEMGKEKYQKHMNDSSGNWVRRKGGKAEVEEDVCIDKHRRKRKEESEEWKEKD